VVLARFTYCDLEQEVRNASQERPAANVSECRMSEIAA